MWNLLILCKNLFKKENINRKFFKIFYVLSCIEK